MNFVSFIIKSLSKRPIKMFIYQPISLFKKLLFAGLVLISLIFLVLVARKPQDEHKDVVECKLTNEEPNFDMEDVNFIESGDSNTLVGFAGYFLYAKTTKKSKDLYADLSPHSASAKLDQNNQILSLESNCAKLNFHIKSKDTKSWVDDVQVTLIEPSQGLTDCNLVATKLISYDNHKHYKCKEERIFQCYAKIGTKSKSQQVVAGTLVMNRFEFETSNSSTSISKHKRGEFNSPAYECTYNWR